MKETTREQTPARTRFDRTRRNVLIGVVLAIVLIGTGSAAGLTAFGGSGARRGTNATPRVIDVWAVYPDGTLRYVEIVHPPDGVILEAVDLAGPLVDAEEDVASLEAFGGEITGVEYTAGPGQDAERVYPLVTLVLDGSETYELDVATENSPYISPGSAADGEMILSLGTQPQDYYSQFIVAVALPPGADVTDVPDYEPYREARIGGWSVTYFDTTDVTGGEAIRVTYHLAGADSPPPELDPRRVDARR